MVLKWIGGYLFSIALLVVILVSSVEIVVYGDKDYFQQEYEKYNVTQRVSMTMEDLLVVTDHMMSYLKGHEDDLNILVPIGNEKQLFFNERELSHMKDVKLLFLGAIWLRRIAIVFLLLLLLFYTKVKKQRILMVSFLRTAFAALCGFFLLAILAAMDFNKYFTLFHKIFFRNNLWILNPETDRLINIVPEPFFVDTAVRIGITFAAATTGLCILFFWLSKRKGEDD